METAQVICIHRANRESWCGIPIPDGIRSFLAPRRTCKACSAKLELAIAGGLTTYAAACWMVEKEFEFLNDA